MGSAPFCRAGEYSPQHGRWNQQDPNQTAINLIEASVYHGRGVAAIVMAFDVEGLYGDGGNLYEYLGSNPWMRFDPMGLSWDPFDMVDEFYAEHMGSAAALLSQLGQSAKAVAVVAATIATYLPFPAASLAGEVALYALGETDASEFAVAAAIGVVPGGKLGSFIGKLGGSAWNTAKQYASRAGGFLARGAEGLAQRAKRLVRACGCFEAGTLVWTARGLVPIEQLVEGYLVFAKNAETGEFSAREVLRTYVRHGAPIVVVAVTTVDGRTTEYRTTEEHPFWVEARGWVRAGALEVGDAVLLLDGHEATVTAVAFTSRRTTVYNLEIEGVHTYLVGTDGLLVHNNVCDQIRKWYDGLVRQIPEKALARPGGATLENARWAHAERNRIRAEARNKMRQNGLAEQADNLDRTRPNLSWDEVYNKYNGDPRKIIEKAGSHADLGL